MDTAMLRRRRSQGDAMKPQDLPALTDGSRGLERGGQIIGQEVVPASQALRKAETDARFLTPKRPPPAIEERMGMSEPTGTRARMPPLFTDQQVAEVEELQRRTSLLPTARTSRTRDPGHGRDDPAEAAKPESRDRGRGYTGIGGGGATAEDVKPDSLDRARDGSRMGVPNGLEQEYETQYFNMANGASSEEEKAADQVMWRWRVGREINELGLLLRAAEQENRQLRQEIQELRMDQQDVRFSTPDEQPKRPQGAGPQPQGRGVGEREEGSQEKATSSGTSTADRNMEFMLLMMQNMQELQKRFLDDNRKDKDTIDGIEMIRTGTTELPMLAEWDPQEAPLRMGDWVTLLEPLIADMSATSEEWWQVMMREVNAWYLHHLSLSPLDRTGHLPDTPLVLQERRWKRLEKRVAGLLLKAIPEAQREEMVARKCLTVFGIMTTLQVSYQPGGLGEKRSLLKSLEEPAEAASSTEAVVALRKWMRWRARTVEICAMEPDPAILMKGLTRLCAKVLEGNQELRFRISHGEVYLTGRQCSDQRHGHQVCYPPLGGDGADCLRREKGQGFQPEDQDGDRRREGSWEGSELGREAP